MEDFPNIAISLLFPISRRLLKKFIGMLHFASSIHCFPLTVSRWQPVLPLGRPLFDSNIVTSWHPCLVKVPRINRPAMISTTTVISPPTLLWSPINGDCHPAVQSLFLKLYSIGRCWTTNGNIQNRTNSSLNAFWRTGNSIVQLETRWRLRLDSVGGENYLFFPLVYVSSFNVITDHGSARICPGQHLAHSTVTLAAASVLSTFDLLRKVDENGREIEPKREYKPAGMR